MATEAEIWEATSLLLHGDSPIEDVSDAETTVTSVSVTSSTDTAKFGDASLKVDPGQYLDVAIPAIGTQDFTIDTWIYRKGTTNLWIFSMGSCIGNITTTAGIAVYWNYTNGIHIFSGTDLLTATGAPALNDWSHFAVVRKSGVFLVFLDGTLIGSIAASRDIASDLRLGDLASRSGVAGWYGYMDEIRYVSGIALWDASFTPPDAPYSAYVPPPAASYSITGKTTLAGNPAQATLRLYEALTGEFRAEVESDALTGEYEIVAEEVAEVGDALWDNVSFYLKLSGTAGSSYFPDEAGNAAASGFLAVADSWPTVAIVDGGPFGTGALGLPGVANGCVGISQQSLPYIAAQKFTLEMYILPKTGGHGTSYPRVFQLGRNEATSGVLAIVGVANTNPMEIFVQGRVSNGWVNLIDANASHTIPNDVATHVAVERDATGFRLYFDHELIASKPDYATYVIAQLPAMIGANTAGSEYFKGEISHVRLTVGECRSESGFNEVADGYPIGPVRFDDPVMADGETYHVLALFGEGIRPLAHGPIIPVVTGVVVPEGPTDPYWDNVVLLLSGKDSIVDLSPADNALTIQGAVLTDAQSHFPQYGTSLDMTGTNRILIPSANFQLTDNGNWTIELWAWVTSPFPAGESYRVFFDFNRPNVTLQLWADGRLGTGVARSAAGTLNAWHHYACTCTDGVIDCYVDGVKETSWVSTYTFNANTWLYFSGFSSNLWHITGYAQDVRITRGIARYAGNFTPPAEPFAP